MVFDPETTKRKAEVDVLLAKANIYRMRHEYVQAEDVCREAYTLDESRLDIAEMIGDLLVIRGQMEAAAEQYKKVFEKEPRRTSAETKYAKAIIEIGEKEYQKKLAQERLDNPKKFAPPPKHPLVAFILSLLFPGAGQMYNGEIVKGGIIIGIVVFSIAILALSPTDIKNLLVILGSIWSPPPQGVSQPPVSTLVWLVLAVLAPISIYAIIDAPISASKDQSDKADNK